MLTRPEQPRLLTRTWTRIVLVTSVDGWGGVGLGTYYTATEPQLARRQHQPSSWSRSPGRDPSGRNPARNPSPSRNPASDGAGDLMRAQNVSACSTFFGAVVVVAFFSGWRWSSVEVKRGEHQGRLCRSYSFPPSHCLI